VAKNLQEKIWLHTISYRHRGRSRTEIRAQFAASKRSRPSSAPRTRGTPLPAVGEVALREAPPAHGGCRGRTRSAREPSPSSVGDTGDSRARTQLSPVEGVEPLLEVGELVEQLGLVDDLARRRVRATEPALRVDDRRAGSATLV
jgi:hypothetical protein